MISYVLFLALSYLDMMEMMIFIFHFCFLMKFFMAAPRSLMMLLSLEVMSMINLVTCSLMMVFSTLSFFIILITLFVAEACLGLSLLIAISRFSGSSLIKF